MEILLLKLFLAPLLVVGSALAGRRWGPSVAGVLVGLPIVAGPILFITYRLHDADFAVVATNSSLLGLVSLAVFAVVYARVAHRARWLATVATTWIAVLAVDFALSFIHVGVPVSFAITLVATALAMFAMPKIAAKNAGGPRPPRWDLSGRALATAILVLTVTTASTALGPRWTGLLAPFPIATSVLAVFVHAQSGAAVVTRALAGVLTGLFSFATFCLTVAVLVRPLGAVAFVIGAAVTIIVQLLVGRVRDALQEKLRDRGKSLDECRMLTHG